jgi:anhydro-N-acetylmuramic acid kinase
MKIIGTMSGTSCDGLDIAFCEFDNHYKETRLVKYMPAFYEFDTDLREKLKLLTSGNVNVSEIAYANVYIAKKHAELINRFIKENDIKDVDLLVSHGQTVFHDTNNSEEPFRPNCTLQIGDGDYLSHLTGLRVLSDLRMKDMAAGGQGAPLVPYADYVLFVSGVVSVGLQNIGGIGNITVIEKGAAPDDIRAFDTGPGNVIIDWACQEYFGVQYDKGGEYSKKGEVIPSLLELMWEVEKDYFNTKPPKSTGKEIRYNQKYFSKIEAFIRQNDFKLEDIVRTSVEFTAQTIVESIKKYAFEPDVLYVTGGGSKNPTLLECIKNHLIHSELRTMEEDLNDAKEAIAFAILGNEYLHNHFSNMKSATGASKDVVLGKLSIPE